MYFERRDDMSRMREFMNIFDTKHYWSGDQYMHYPGITWHTESI